MSSATVVLRRLSVAFSTRQNSRLLARTIHKGCTARQRHEPPNPVLHGAENYFVDGDDTPLDTPLYKVDATSDAVESAYEPPSGPWSRAGAGTGEYRAMSKDESYDAPSSRDVKLKYGGTKGYTENKGPETSRAGRGTEGTDRWGRKPEGQA